MYEIHSIQVSSFFERPINKRSYDKTLVEEYAALTLISDGAISETSYKISHETRISVSIAGEHLVQMVCTASQIPEMLIGYMYSEGFIADISDVLEIKISPDSTWAELTFKDDHERHAGDWICETTGRKQIFKKLSPPEKIISSTSVMLNAKSIFSLAETFYSETCLYKDTRGTHSCLLSVAKDVLFLCEDIGRHNAMDKVIGSALLDGVDLNQAILFTSGRVPLDMVRKLHGKKIQSIVIGPAGENLMRNATLTTSNDNVAAKSGFGAVFGSKNLKALSVSGSGAVVPADIEKLFELRQKMGMPYMRPNPVVHETEHGMDGSGLISGLAQGGFVEACSNVVFVGGSGSGKTHLATAIGLSILRRRKKVRFWGAVDLANVLEQEKTAQKGGRWPPN